MNTLYPVSKGLFRKGLETWLLLIIALCDLPGLESPIFQGDLKPLRHFGLAMT